MRGERGRSRSNPQPRLSTTPRFCQALDVVIALPEEVEAPAFEMDVNLPQRAGLKLLAFLFR